LKHDVIVIGAGFSGLAAALRFIRYRKKPLVLEAHDRPGGLSSWYRRGGRIFESGLHALTSFAPPDDRAAPINRMLRQLGLSRDLLGFLPQSGARVVFADGAELGFSNDIELLRAEIASRFPGEADGFDRLCAFAREADPGRMRPGGSAREFVAQYIGDPLLASMLLFPLIVYGASSEHDLDVLSMLIMFRAIYLEGLFRPAVNVRELLGALVAAIEDGGGEVRFGSPVARVVVNGGRVEGVELADGGFVPALRVISTAGLPVTMKLLGRREEVEAGRISFFETQYVLDRKTAAALAGTETVYFYNFSGSSGYRCPDGLTEPAVGSMCLPHRFRGREGEEPMVRVTNLGNYRRWKALSRDEYVAAKEDASRQAARFAERIIGPFSDGVLFRDAFTPVTIERFSRRPGGAVYGSPEKRWDGGLGVDGLLLAGTDQGLVGVVGAMISGVNTANRMLLPMRLGELRE